MGGREMREEGREGVRKGWGVGKRERKGEEGRERGKHEG